MRTNVEIDSFEIGTTGLAMDLRDQKDYKTGYFGKWGLGRISGGPWNQGYDRFVGQLGHVEAHNMYPVYYTSFDANISKIPASEADITSLAIPIQPNSGKIWNEKNCPLTPSSTCVYINDIVRDEAFSFIGNKQNRPFFAVWAPTYPHAGGYSWKDSLRSPVRRYPLDRIGTMVDTQRGHAAQIESHLDVDMGKLLDIIDGDPTLDEETLIVFTSDNGAQADAVQYDVTKFLSTGGLRGYKRFVYEGGIRVPTIIRYKGRFPAGTISRIPHALYDLGATFREASGLPPKFFNGTFGEPGGAASMFKAWLTGDEADAPDRGWIHTEVCLDGSGVDKGCDTATLDISRWREPNGNIIKLLLMRQRTQKYLFNLKSDPAEIRPLKNKTLESYIWHGIVKNIRSEYNRYF
jgi:arylsulfatase A-like enzyme